MVEKNYLANNSCQNLILMYEIFTFPAVSEISDSGCTGSCETDFARSFNELKKYSSQICQISLFTRPEALL